MEGVPKMKTWRTLLSFNYFVIGKKNKENVGKIQMLFCKKYAAWKSH